jgi:hypothetical protein
MQWTDDSLKSQSHEKRHNVWVNAKRLGNEELRLKIEALDLPHLNPAGFKLDSPAGEGCKRSFSSLDGRAAGIEAADQGLPALAKVEPLLRRALGQEYENAYEATVQAGYVVANMMEQNGFRKTGRKGSMPTGSIAKTAELFVRRS